MSGLSLALILVQGTLFFVWAYLMFRTLFMLAGRARRSSGRVIPGLPATLRTWADWLTSPEDKRNRALVGGTTLGLFALIGLNMAVSK